MPVSETNNSDASNNILLIANTHLFYHGLAGYLRLLQTNEILKILKDLTLQVSQKYQYHNLTDSFSWRNTHTNTHSPTPTRDEASGNSESYTNCEENLVLIEEDFNRLSVAERKESKISIIFAGDLNSTTSSAVIEFLKR